MNFHLFATESRPLRPSGLAWLSRCPVQVMLQYDEIDVGGPAAQTGSVVHKAVEAFHLAPDTAKGITAAVAALQTAGAEFPDHDPTEARIYTEAYLGDPRNQTAKVVALEQKVTLRLPPHPLDPTGQDIHVRGTLDQIREENGRLLVCDLKTGKTGGWQMLHDYALQQAAYVLAARASGWPTAEPGYLIAAYGYRVRGAKLPSPDGVFWWLPFDVSGAEMLLDRVRLQVALIRRGEIDFGPGPHCCYCPQKGLDSCVPAANRKLFSLPVVAA